MNDPTPFSLCLIVRNNAEILDRCLASAQSLNPAEILIVNTAVTPDEEGSEETDAVAAKYGARIEYFPWVKDFSAARNFAFAQCSHEVVMWLDTDDEVVGGSSIAEAIRGFARDSRVNCIQMDYKYEFAGQPNRSPCTTDLVRERVVKKSQFVWKSPIHEVLCCKRPLAVMRVLPETGYVFQHLTKGEDGDEVRAKLKRNIGVFEKNWPDGDCEPRMHFYWGNTHLGLGEREEALTQYEKYLRSKGTAAAERYVVLCSTAETLRQLKRHGKSLVAANMAVTDHPHLPSGWLHKAEAHFLQGQKEQALSAADMCLRNHENHANELVSNPAALKTRPNFIKSFFSFRDGNIEDAKKFLSRALDANPYDEISLKLRDEIAEADRNTRMGSAFLKVCKEISSQGDDDLAEQIAKMAPGDLKYDMSMQFFWQVPPAPRDKSRVAIMCADAGLTGWDHSSLTKGISGSEEAAIHVSRQFADRGWFVDVYNARDMATTDGEKIRYLPYSTWRPDREYDVVIYWRMPMGASDFPVRSSSTKRLLWLHDVCEPERFPRYAHLYDKVICLSEFHRKVNGLEGEPNVLISRNGIDVDNMPTEVEKDMNMVIWPSDPYRGALRLFEWWDELKEANPDLHLHILYGFSEKFDQHAAQLAATGDHSMHELKLAVLEFAERDDVTYHGMVPQSECHELMAKAGWWLYPTEFPEISCITAMKAQALGCRVITTDDFALSETVQYGYKIPRGEWDLFKRSVKENLANPEKMAEMVEEGKEWAKSLGWGPVVDQWLEACKEVETWGPTPSSNSSTQKSLA